MKIGIRIESRIKIMIFRGGNEGKEGRRRRLLGFDFGFGLAIWSQRLIAR
jgi:hypothetical protein